MKDILVKDRNYVIDDKVLGRMNESEVREFLFLLSFVDRICSFFFYILVILFCILVM